MRNRLPLLALLLLLGLALAAAPARAQCQLTVTPVDFGAYDVFDPAPLSSTGSLTYFCANAGRTVQVQLGTGGSGTFFPRQMASGAERLAYNLYLDAAATQVWGDGSGGSRVFTGTTGTPGRPDPERTFTLILYGRVPAGQSPGLGIYTDTIVVTLNL